MKYSPQFGFYYRSFLWANFNNNISFLCPAAWMCICSFCSGVLSEFDFCLPVPGSVLHIYMDPKTQPFPPSVNKPPPPHPRKLPMFIRHPTVLHLFLPLLHSSSFSSFRFSLFSCSPYNFPSNCHRAISPLVINRDVLPTVSVYVCVPSCLLCLCILAACVLLDLCPACLVYILPVCALLISFTGWFVLHACMSSLPVWASCLTPCSALLCVPLSLFRCILAACVLLILCPACMNILPARSSPICVLPNGWFVLHAYMPSLPVWAFCLTQCFAWISIIPAFFPACPSVV